jgi:LPS-assembly protein
VARAFGPARRVLGIGVRAGAVLVAMVFVASLCLSAERASAQSVGNLLHFPQRPTPPKPPPQPANQPMLVQATEIRYDYTNNTVSAVGNVQIYYNGATIEADEVTYDQKSKRLRAQGNVRLTEADGKITYGQVIDLTDDYRDGFVDSLRLETVDDTHFAAARADRSQGNFTVMQSGVYTACEPCADNPKKPPLWQVQAARIVHDQSEKMLYFEDARIEFFGVPLAWVPFMSAPDPTVKRKSGFLFPTVSDTTQYGVGVEVPYYWALAPNYDVTVSTLATSRQGVLFQGQWRHRLMDGSYTIQAAGIFQQDPGYFAGRDGVGSATADNFRGSVQTSGQFAITDKWVWGWNGLLVTDPLFFQDYKLSQFSGAAYDPFLTGVASEGVSQVYLTGIGDRSYFDIRSMYYYGFSAQDIQSELPIIHPVLDYSNVLAQQVMGGELSYKLNLTSLTRQQAEFDAINQTAINGGLCASGSADTAVLNQNNCLLRGIPGDYNRVSAETDWRRTLVTSNGQEITPFFHLRGDFASLYVDNQPGVSNYIAPGQSDLARVMPTAGVEYRYPFVDAEPWGTQTIEPIAQLILRPNEGNIGRFPNEDAQSLVFSDANLFSIDKFSGWDRAEGGGRVNAGFQYTAQVNQAGSLNVLFGQSYQIYGTNSFAAGDISNTGLNSGLDKTVSDYVGRVTYQPNQVYSFTARGRFDEQTFAVERLELESRANFDRWTLQVLYGNYAPQPELGFLFRRQGILGGASVKLTQNWILLGSARYDLYAHEFDQSRLGIGYTDDCFLLSLNWLTGYTYNGTTTPTKDNTFMLQLSLRTLGPDFLAPVGAAF